MPSTSPAAGRQTWPDWIKPLFEAIDARDAIGFAEYLTDDATFYFGNAPGVTGKPAIVEAVAGFFAGIAKLEHRVASVLSQSDIVVCSGDVHYTRHDGSVVVLPFADRFLLQDGSIREYRIYMDINPLFAPQ